MNKIQRIEDLELQIIDLKKENEKLKEIWNIPTKAECGVCDKDCSKGSINIYFPEIKCTVVFCSVKCLSKVSKIIDNMELQLANAKNEILDKVVAVCNKELEKLSNLTDKRWISHSYSFTLNLKSALLELKKEAKI